MTLDAATSAERDIAHHIHPQTDLDAHVRDGHFNIVRAEGVRLYDEDGHAYIDGLAGLWSASLGYSETRIIDAVTAQMQRLPYSSTFAQRSHPAATELAERLTAIAPEPLSHAMFMNSGSEAIDTAVKLVWYYWNAHGRPGKKKIIAREKAYHGSTIVAASLTGLPRMQEDFDLPVQGVVRAPCPHFWRHGRDGESETAFARRMADELEALILQEGPDTVGAFFAEPIQGAGGVILPPVDYFDHVQAICRKHDILFVADEVICGFGRTGKMWGSELYALRPDMMTTAKALSSSYLPISALLVSTRVSETLRAQSRKLGQFGHGFTYAGHPACAAAALATLDIYEERDIVARAAEMAPYLQNGLRALASHTLIGEVRGTGMIAGVELTRGKDPATPFDAGLGAGRLVQDAARERGLLVRALGDTLAFCPPLIISEADIALMLERFADALDAVGSTLSGA
ncbi:MAG: aminotransferase [Pseudomonadota bacterium]